MLGVEVADMGVRRKTVPLSGLVTSSVPAASLSHAICAGRVTATESETMPRSLTKPTEPKTASKLEKKKPEPAPPLVNGKTPYNARRFVDVAASPTVNRLVTLLDFCPYTPAIDAFEPSRDRYTI